MMKTIRVGMRREDKSEFERRAPLTPNDIHELQNKHGLEFVVEPSPSRIFPESLYEEVGAEISTDFSGCDIIFGIKEVPIPRLIPNKPYVFFSHTIKGQSYNMPLLQKVLDNNITLIDYERVVDDKNRRLIAFSYQAGQAGLINTVWSLGQRWQKMGFETPFLNVKQACTYEGGLEEVRNDLQRTGKEILSQGIPSELAPCIIALTGIGRVAQGAQDLLKELNSVQLQPSDLLSNEKISALDPKRVYFVVLDMEHFLTHADGTEGFDFSEYLAIPEKYVSRFHDYIPAMSALVNGIYWEEKFPRLVTLEIVQRLFANGKAPKLTVIGDVTCDPGGSVQCTVKPTYPNDPVYVYNPDTNDISMGFDGHGLQIMAVDILPTEIATESSMRFGAMLKPYLANVAKADFSLPFSELNLPAPFKRATITHQGELTPDYKYLQEFLEK